MAENLTTLTKGICERILVELNNITGKNTPESLLTKNGMLEAITSPQNRNGFEAVPLGQGTGKVRVARVSYLQRDIVSDAITDSSDRTCGTGTEKTMQEVAVEVTHYVGSRNITLTREDMRQYCTDTKAFGTWFNRVLMSSMNSVRTALNQEILTHILNNCVGVNNNNVVSGAPSASAKAVTVLTGDCKTNCIDGINEMLVDYGEHQFQGTPLIVGQGNFKKAMLNLQWGCCNDGEIDWDKVSNYISTRGFSFWDDHNANSILGADNVLMLAPGVTQVVFWNDNAGDGGIDFQGTFGHMMFADPIIPGLMWDFDVHYDDCNKEYWLQFGVYWEPYCLPTDAFATGDELEGVTGVFLYEAQSA